VRAGMGRRPLAPLPFPVAGVDPLGAVILIPPVAIPSCALFTWRGELSVRIGRKTRNNSLILHGITVPQQRYLRSVLGELAVAEDRRAAL